MRRVVGYCRIFLWVTSSQIMTYYESLVLAYTCPTNSYNLTHIYISLYSITWLLPLSHSICLTHSVGPWHLMSLIHLLLPLPLPGSPTHTYCLAIGLSAFYYTNHSNTSEQYLFTVYTYLHFPLFV